MNQEHPLSHAALRVALTHLLAGTTLAERLSRCGAEAQQLTGADRVELWLGRIDKHRSRYQFSLLPLADDTQAQHFDSAAAREQWLRQQWPTVIDPVGAVPAGEPTSPRAYRLARQDGTLLALVVVHDGDPIAAVDDPCWAALHTWLCLASLALDCLGQTEDSQQMLDAIVQVIARMVDEKSAHTFGHCQRVPLLTDMLLDAVQQDTGEYADVELDADQQQSLRLAAWLHDCGKLAVPDAILDKATKLHGVRDGLAEIDTRLAVLRAQQLAALPATAGQAARQTLKEQIQDDRDFLHQINLGSAPLSDADRRRIEALAALQWTDLDGQRQPLLSEQEVALLCIPQGTLSAEERVIMNHHAQVTLNILEALPFPPRLAAVADYAASHHERPDGSGFPRGLCGDQLPLPSRMLAIADVFEALTASDRPYKRGLPLSQALAVMKNLRDRNQIDAGLYRLFIEAGVWRRYSEQMLPADQQDVTDVDPYR